MVSPPHRNKPEQMKAPNFVHNPPNLKAPFGRKSTTSRQITTVNFWYVSLGVALTLYNPLLRLSDTPSNRLPWPLKVTTRLVDIIKRSITVDHILAAPFFFWSATSPPRYNLWSDPTTKAPRASAACLKPIISISSLQLSFGP